MKPYEVDRLANWNGENVIEIFYPNQVQMFFLSECLTKDDLVTVILCSKCKVSNDNVDCHGQGLR